MSKPFFHNSSECYKLHPPPFAREAKRLISFYSARFSHFIDSLRHRGFPSVLFVLIKKSADFFAAVLPELFKHEFKNKAQIFIV